MRYTKIEENPLQKIFCTSLGTRSISNELVERVGAESNSISLEELVLELDPMKTKSVKETFQDIHHQQHTEGHSSKKSKSKVRSKPIHTKRTEHTLFPKDSGKFGVCKRKRPETKVGSSI